jgi:hypothetical protein
MSEGFPAFAPFVVLGAIVALAAAPVAAGARLEGSAGSSGGRTTAGPYTEAGDIASNFDVSTTLKRSWGSGDIAVENSNDVVGAFRFICGAGQLRYDDPIVYPGQPGRSHLHQFYGNTSANANSTFASLRASGDSTCNNMGNGTAANRSAYWIPAMLDGKGHVVQPDYVQVYYKREPTGPGTPCDPQNPRYHGICVGIPNGLKFIFGFDMLGGDPETHVGHYKCTGAGARTVAVKSLADAKDSCRVGSHLVASISTPTCWDGKNLDSPNHRDHLSLARRNRNTGMVKCPTTHPYYMPKFTLSIFYRVGEGDDIGLWQLSSDHMYPNRPHGATLHADYFEAWDNSVKDIWLDNCIGRKLNCSGGDLGNGQQLKGAAKPKYGWINPDRLVPIPQGGMM